MARPAPGAGHSSPCRHAFGVHGWAPGGTRSSGGCRTRSPPPRALPSAFTRACARLRQVRRLPDGPREERRRPARLPAAPENLPQGSAPRNGAASARAHCGSGRFSAASVGGLHLMPPLQGARHDPLRGRDSLTRAAQTRRVRRICAGACPSAPSKPIFRSKSLAQGPKWPPLAEFCPKNGLRRRSKAAGNSSGSRRTTCFRRPACQARTYDRACHRPDRAGAFGTGVGPCGPPRYGLPIPEHFLTAPNQNPRSARRAPVSPECDFFLPRGREPGPRSYAAPAARCG